MSQSLLADCRTEDVTASDRSDSIRSSDRVVFLDRQSGRQEQWRPLSTYLAGKSNIVIRSPTAGLDAFVYPAAMWPQPGQPISAVCGDAGRCDSSSTSRLPKPSCSDIEVDSRALGRPRVFQPACISRSGTAFGLPRCLSLAGNFRLLSNHDCPRHAPILQENGVDSILAFGGVHQDQKSLRSNLVMQ
jgi:hypothetical protein